MENKVKCKELKVCLERLPLNVETCENVYENWTHSSKSRKKTCSKQVFAGKLSDDVRLKKRVSFSKQSSILCFDDDEATNVLQNSFSQEFDPSIESVNGALESSNTENDSFVIPEKLPQTLSGEYVEKISVQNESYQRMDFTAVDKNIKCSNLYSNHNGKDDEYIPSSNSIPSQQLACNPCTSEDFRNAPPLIHNINGYSIRDVRIIIECLPDNVIKRDCNNHKDAGMKNSKSKARALKRKLNLKRKTPNRKRPRVEKMQNFQLLENLDNPMQHLDVGMPAEISPLSNSLETSDCVEKNEVEMELKRRINLRNCNKVSVENKSNSQKVVGKKTVSSADKFTPDLIALKNIPSVNEDGSSKSGALNVNKSPKSFPDLTKSSSTSSSIKSPLVGACALVIKQNSKDQNYFDVCPKTLCVHLERLDLQVPNISTGSSEYNLLQNTRSTGGMKLQTVNHKKAFLQKKNNNELKKTNRTLSRISKLKHIKQSIDNSSQRSQDCPNDGSSSDEDLPLCWLARNLSISQQTLHFDSIKNTQKAPEQSTDRVCNAEDCIPSACLKVVNSAETPILPANLPRAHNMPVLSPDNSSEENCPLSEVGCSNKSLLSKKSKRKNKPSKFHANIAISNKRNVSMDHCYFKTLDHQIVIDHSYNIPLNSNSHINKLSSSKKIKSNTFSLSTNPQTVIKKRNGNVLKKKDAQKKLNSSISVNSPSKANLKLGVKSKNKGLGKKIAFNKKKYSKKAIRKSQVKVYEMMIKYLQKQIKFKYFKEKSPKGAKKCKRGLKEHLKVKPLQPLKLRIERGTDSSTDTANEGDSCGSLSTERMVEVVSSAVVCEEKQLQPLNIKVEPESEYRVETGAVCVINECDNYSSGSLFIEEAIEVASEAVFLVDCSQNKNTQKGGVCLMEQSKEKQLLPVNVKVEPKYECLDVEAAVCMENENCSFGSVLPIKAIEIESEAAFCIDSSQSTQKSTDCLMEQSKKNQLLPLNIKVEPECECIDVESACEAVFLIDSSQSTQTSNDCLMEQSKAKQILPLNIKVESECEYIDVEAGAVCLINGNSSHGSILPEKATEVASEAVFSICSSQSTQTSDDCLMEQSKAKQILPLNIKVKKECEYSDVEAGAVCTVSENGSSGSVLPERAIEVASEAVFLVDSSQSTNPQKSKDCLMEQSKKKHLQPLNIIEVQSEFECNINTVEVETESYFSGLASTESTVEVTSKDLGSIIDNSEKQNKDCLTKQSEKKYLQPLNIKVESESECFMDTVEVETEAVCVINESCSSGMSSSESTVCFLNSSQGNDANQKPIKKKVVDKYRLGFLTQNKSLRHYNKCLASERLLFSKYKIKKRQRKELKKMLRNLKKVCHIK